MFFVKTKHLRFAGFRSNIFLQWEFCAKAMAGAMGCSTHDWNFMLAVRKHLFLLLFFGRKARPISGNGMSENHAENHDGYRREHQV